MCVNCHTDFHNVVREIERKIERESGAKVQDNSTIILEVAEWFWK